jgi:DNA-binding response OmpR family regulator/tetratricopeptide (TPR) repeat protein
MAGYVLIVESDAGLHRQIDAALRKAGFELAAESEGAWAKRSIEARPPDVLVLDTRLDDGDGFRLAEELRRDPHTRGTPILFIASAFRGNHHRAEARRRFAPAEYLATPLDVRDLAPRLAELAARAVRTPPPTPEPALEPNTEPDVTAAAKAMGANDPVQVRERRDVERSAKHLVADPTQAELTGTLKRIPFARLIQRLYAQRATGSLLLLRDAREGEAEPVKKIVAFSGGYPVSVRSTVLGECLGQILLERKLITGAALGESVRRMQREKRQQGQILVEMGALSPYNLERALTEQVEAKLFEIFSWVDGKFMFKADDIAPPETARLEGSPAGLILEGIRRHYDDARLEAALNRYAGQYVALASDPVLRLQEMTSDATELAFIQSIDGSRQLESLLGHAKIPRDKAYLLLVALSEAGMIQGRETTTRRRAPAAPASAAPAQPAAEPLSSGQLAMMLQTVRTQDHFWVLGVEQTATAAAVDHAYEALARSFHADRYRLAPDDDRETAEEIFERLTEAHRTLRDPARRRAYVAKQERAAADAEPRAPTPPPAPAPTPMPSELTPVMTLEEAPVIAPAIAIAPTPTPAPSNAAARSLYEVGLEHLRARRHHEAVEALRQAARLIPNEADFRAALGWALFRQAPADARAGRAAVAELRRALQLDERHREAAQRLAEIYAQTGHPELAVQELERLLAMDPGDAEVAEELRRLRTR